MKNCGYTRAEKKSFCVKKKTQSCFLDYEDASEYRGKMTGYLSVLHGLRCLKKEARKHVQLSSSHPAWTLWCRIFADSLPSALHVVFLTVQLSVVRVLWLLG